MGATFAAACVRSYSLLARDASNEASSTVIAYTHQQTDTSLISQGGNNESSRHLPPAGYEVVDDGGGATVLLLLLLLYVQQIPARSHLPHVGRACTKQQQQSEQRPEKAFTVLVVFIPYRNNRPCRTPLKFNRTVSS